MKLSELKPSTVYTRTHNSWRLPDFFITGDPVWVEEDRHPKGRPFGPVSKVKVVYVRAIELVDGKPEISRFRTEASLSQVAYEIGTVEQFVQRMRQDEEAEARAIADRQRRLDQVKALQAYLKDEGVAAHPVGADLRITDLDAFANLLGLDPDTQEDDSDASA